MPKVTFVNEHREVEVDRGSLISEAASQLGIDVCREHFVGTNFGNKSVWVDGDTGCVSEPTFFERVFGRCKGQRRLANRVRVLKDCRVWTQQGMSGRTGQDREIDPAPRPSEDETNRFDHEHSTAGTAWNVYGHPKTIGSGKREPPKYEEPKKKAAVKKDAPAKAKADAAKGKKDAPAKATADDAKAKKAEPAKDEAKADKAEEKADDAKAKTAEPAKDEAKAEKAEEKADEAKAKKAEPAKDEAEPKTADGDD